jgi:hypothetical protein
LPAGLYRIEKPWRAEGRNGPTMTPARTRIAQAEDDLANRRLHPRVGVVLPAFLILGGRRYPVQVVDLSAGGAKLDCGQALVAVGATVTLNWSGGNSKATVRWREGRLAGLAFAVEIEERDVLALARRSEALAARMAS